ncbi:hypothetical protein [Bradyrhizobium sp. dw_411]|uniref:hypothetical protein n=1 Tax=Bradyrhizobium sp. dw_411 TaxID=2720082 RepID=UPI001BD0205A|nr:hypothetical protein [Bradyrhizobium sp. dw_411]
MAGRRRDGTAHSVGYVRMIGEQRPDVDDVIRDRQMLRGEAHARWFNLLARLCHAERGSSGLYDGLIWPNDGCASIG